MEEWFQKNVTERGYGQKVNLSFGTNDVDKKYLNSEEYSRKFSRITSNSRVNNALRKFAKGTLSKFGGTNTEALLVIDGKTGKELIRKTGEKNKLTVVLSEDEIEYLRNYEGEKIAIHNHPTNLYPTGSDFVAAGYRKYAFGIVATHDGRLYKYSAGSDPVPTSFMDSKIDKQTGRGYNINEPEVREGFEKALDELRKECGIKWTEIK